jgi:hypothetical protein
MKFKHKIGNIIAGIIFSLLLIAASAYAGSETVIMSTQYLPGF